MDVSTGPQPDWDPDIVAALDDPEMNFDLDDQLEDDFVLKVRHKRTHTHTHTHTHNEHTYMYMYM